MGERERLVFAAFAALEELLELEAPEAWEEYLEAHRLTTGARRWSLNLPIDFEKEMALLAIEAAKAYFALKEAYPGEWLEFREKQY